MTTAEFYQPWSAERLRHLLFGPYDYERKLEGSEVPNSPGGESMTRTHRSPGERGQSS